MRALLTLCPPPTLSRRLASVALLRVKGAPPLAAAVPGRPPTFTPPPPRPHTAAYPATPALAAAATALCTGGRPASTITSRAASTITTTSSNIVHISRPTPHCTLQPTTAAASLPAGVASVRTLTGARTARALARPEGRTTRTPTSTPRKGGGSHLDQHRGYSARARSGGGAAAGGGGVRRPQAWDRGGTGRVAAAGQAVTGMVVAAGPEEAAVGGVQPGAGTEGGRLGEEATGSLAAALPKAYVRAPPGGDTLVVTVSLGGKTCNLNRPMDETLDKALTRLAKNLLAKPSKKEKRKKPGAWSPSGTSTGADTSTDDGGVPPAVLYDDPQGTRPLSRSLSNGEAWLAARVLEVAGERFAVEVNPPTVDRLSIDRLAMVGYPTAGAVTLSYADPGACQWRWSAQRPGTTAWEDLGCTTQHYTPIAADEGAVLRVECIPGVWRTRQEEARGELWLGEIVSGTTGPVQHGPETCSASVRCGHTPAHLHPPAFRILSYNILADQYAGSDYAKNVLFNYCPKECLDPGYRRPLVLRELLGYRADVVCLQEVDERAFTDFLQLHLGLQGYSGHYTNKQGKVREGSATFWRTGRFRRLASTDILLRHAFRRPLPPLHAQFEPLLAASPELETALQQVTTVAQATLLEPLEPGEGEGCLCVVNTHLFFHPYAPHIRTMHTAAILEEAAAFLERASEGALASGELAAGAGGGGGGGGGECGQGAAAVAAALRRYGPHRPTVLFVGDLNSDLNDGIPGVVELLRQGRLPSDYWDWVQGAAFKWGMGEEDAEAMAQATAQIAAASTAAAAAGPAADSGPGAPCPPPSTAPSLAAAAVGSLLAPDGHAFDNAAASPQRPIAVTGIDLTLPYTLRSADDLATPYTNYTSGYKALLDYVWCVLGVGCGGKRQRRHVSALRRKERPRVTRETKVRQRLMPYMGRKMAVAAVAAECGGRAGGAGTRSPACGCSAPPPSPPRPTWAPSSPRATSPRTTWRWCMTWSGGARTGRATRQTSSRNGCS